MPLLGTNSNGTTNDQKSKGFHGSLDLASHGATCAQRKNSASSLSSMSSGALRMTSELSSTTFFGTNENLWPGRNASHKPPQLVLSQCTSDLEPPQIESPDASSHKKRFLESQGSLERLPSLVQGDYLEDIDLDIDKAKEQPPDTARLDFLPSTDFHGNPANSSSEMELNAHHSSSSSSIEEDFVEAELRGPPSPEPGANDLKNDPQLSATDIVPQNFKETLKNFRPGGPKHLKPSEARADLGNEFEPPLQDNTNAYLPASGKTFGHDKISSRSSTDLTSAAKSTESKCISSSAVNGSRKIHWSRLSNFGRGSGRHSDSTHRNSLEGVQVPISILGKGAMDRALQRRRIIREIVVSEASYIHDLRILTHVYFAILGTTPNFPKDMHLKVEDNIKAMITLHEEIFLGMSLVSHDPSERSGMKMILPRRLAHAHYESADNSKLNFRRRKDPSVKASACLNKSRDDIAEPKEAAAIADLFEKMILGTTDSNMGRFSVYENYGATYAEMLQVFASASRTIPSWYAYEHAIEALVNTLLQPSEAGEVNSRKGLTFEDLLIKPIQRICRYPLLFAELEEHCPRIDNLNANTKIRRILHQLRAVAHKVNDATNDLETQARLKRSQHLQEILVFPVAYKSSRSIVRDFGHAKLCGVLHISYQSQCGAIRGDYMLCTLFASYLLIASRNEAFNQYSIVAIIALGDIKQEEATVGIGLQCYNALYTWKLIFKSGTKLYEILLSACTEVEEERWRSELDTCSAWKSQPQGVTGDRPTSSHKTLCLDIRESSNIGADAGHSTRGHSFQRTAALSAQRHTVPVVIKNTYCLSRADQNESPGNGSLYPGRSSSTSTTKQVPILAPDRADRARMEQALSDVWTRGVLPYPAMTTSRSGQYFRASANSVIRRLSKASVTSHSVRRNISRVSATERAFHDETEDPFVEDMDVAMTDLSAEGRIVTYPPALGQFGGVQNRSDGRLSSSSADAVKGDSDTSTKVNSGEDVLRSNNSSLVPTIDEEKVKIKARKSTTLSKAFSREKLKGWFSL